VRRDAATGRNPLTLAALASLWIATLANWPLWRALLALPETATWRGALFVAGFCAMVAALTTALLAFAAWRRTIKPAIALFVVSAALGAHFMGSYGVVIDPTMMTNVLQTNPRETLDLLNLHLVFALLVIAGVPLLWLWRTPVQGLRFAAQLWRNLGTIVACLVLLAALVISLFADLSATMRNHRSMRYLINPVNSFFALGVLAYESNARPSGPPQPIGLDARQLPRPAGAKPTLLVLVVGETARADHFALNGYARPTNPELTPLDPITFRDVTSCGTNTAASLPCMFSALGRRGYESRERDQETLLDLVQRAGLAVLWLDNQAGCKGVCERVPNAFARDPLPGAAPMPAGLCDGTECLDEALLHGLDQRLAALPAERRGRGVLLVMHQMGSHGPAYSKRSPPGRKPFQPECQTNVLQQCGHDALINAYDNSIAYTDHVLAQTIGWLGGQLASFDPVMLYVSDHGESLGENNLYLHGLPYAVAPREQKHVPMLAWFAPQTIRDAGLAPACLRQQADATLSHDHLFHTVLGLLDLRASEYRGELDAFAACSRR
jgi:lipid A ethanolaminephosphotransferase